MKNQFRIPAALLLAMFLLGCGQSGPLYVTGNPSAIQPTAANTSTAEDEKDADESDEQ